MAELNTFGRSENVVLNSGTFKEFAKAPYHEAMTVRGAVNKTAILLAIAVASAVWAWQSTDIGWVMLSALGALAVGWITCLNKSTAPLTAPLYAFLEGSLLGYFSAIFEALYPGIVTQAVLLTFGTLFTLLIVYRVSGFQVTKPFRAGVISATGAIVLVYLVDLAFELNGISGIRFIHEVGFEGIIVNLFVVLIAALNLVLDFDLIESGAREGAPKYMEWYAAFGLMVTLIWLYWEVLKLLIQLSTGSDDN